MGLEFGNACAVSFEPNGEFIEADLQGVGFGRDLSPVGVGALQRVAALSPVSMASRRSASSVVRTAAASTCRAVVVASLHAAQRVRVISPALRLRQRRTGCARTGGSIRQPFAPKRPPERVMTTCEGSARAIEGCLPATVDDDGVTEQHIKEVVDRGASTSNMAADRLGPGRSRGTSSAESDDRAGCVTVAQHLECTTSRGAAVDDDRIERFARGGFERRLPAGLDRNQIEQGAEHTFDLGQPGRTTAGSGLNEGEGECLGSGNPSVVFGLGVGLLGLPVRSIVLGGGFAASAASNAATSGSSSSAARRPRLAVAQQPLRGPDASARVR